MLVFIIILKSGFKESKTEYKKALLSRACRFDFVWLANFDRRKRNDIE
jgi:hypothetical protein